MSISDLPYTLPKRLFYKYQAQTSEAPLALEINRAEGIYLYDDIHQKKYIDAISGISVSNVGHCHPKVVEAVCAQANKYMHLMVYGEYVQSPTVLLAEALCSHLPEKLNNVYFTNSGTEATEAAMKLAKRHTGKLQIASMRNAYHGSTQGALSMIGDEYFKQNYRPLLPGIITLEYNNINDLDKINNDTAAVFIELVQAEAGVKKIDLNYLHLLRKKCDETGTMLVFDEIQTGFGRCGSLFYFEQCGVVPDMILLAKGLGAGMPIGALVASKNIMDSFSDNPVLGHITTYGGNAVCAAAALASLKVLKEENLIEKVQEKSILFQSLLKHPKMKSLNIVGLMIAIEFDSFEINKKIIDICIENGLITDWFLFASNYMRIAPPLIITPVEINKICEIILNAIDQVYTS